MNEFTLLANAPAWLQIIVGIVLTVGGGVVYRFYDRHSTKSERTNTTENDKNRLLFDTMRSELTEFRKMYVEMNEQRLADINENNSYHRQNDRNNYELLQELRDFMQAMAEANNLQTSVISTEIKTQAEQIKAHINDKLTYLHGRLTDNPPTSPYGRNQTDSGDP